MTPHAAREIRLVALGDSLTAGFGLAASEAFPVVLQEKLRQKGYPVTIINAGISGDTTAGGASRVDAALAHDPDGLIVELGANDGLRGLEPAFVRANLEAILDAAKAKGVPVLLCGMRALLGMGPDYGEEFAAVFSDLARERNLAFYPFFLEGVAADPKKNLPDGLHPTAAGIREITGRILPIAEDFVKRIAARSDTVSQASPTP
ncbi:arylesterase [Desulfolutivibrio sulfoxidireducens]|uniref:arylesterase n=1 Tax=Desulfolutivibrio sulfoxidireducens TaxID=2773299 RepID=UPI00159D5515|nr:arylesterase [Desulfolutivibrio sulfoxidireducens]QLA19520.1 arylesterase [Desulfolutivibrio sulfoxidireducens]